MCPYGHMLGSRVQKWPILAILAKNGQNLKKTDTGSDLALFWP